MKIFNYILLSILRNDLRKQSNPPYKIKPAQHTFFFAPGKAKHECKQKKMIASLPTVEKKS